MKTVYIDYKPIRPSALADMIQKTLHCFCSWRRIDEDYFEFIVSECLDLAALENLLAAYV